MLSLHLLSPGHGSHGLKGPFPQRAHLWRIITYQFLPPAADLWFLAGRLCFVIKVTQEGFDLIPTPTSMYLLKVQKGGQEVPALQRH